MKSPIVAKKGREKVRGRKVGKGGRGEAERRAGTDGLGDLSELAEFLPLGLGLRSGEEDHFTAQLARQRLVGGAPPADPPPFQDFHLDCLGDGVIPHLHAHARTCPQMQCVCVCECVCMCV